MLLHNLITPHSQLSHTSPCSPPCILNFCKYFTVFIIIHFFRSVFFLLSMMDDCGLDKPFWSATRWNGLRWHLPVSLCLSVCPSARLLIDIKPISCCILICLLTICGSLPRQPTPLSLSVVLSHFSLFLLLVWWLVSGGRAKQWNYVKMTKSQREMATFARLLIAQQTFTIVACLNLHTQWQRYGQKTWPGRQTGNPMTLRPLSSHRFFAALLRAA